MRATGCFSFSTVLQGNILQVCTSNPARRWAQTPAWQRTVPSVLAERTEMVEEDSLSQLGECDSLAGLAVALQTENCCSRWLSWERKGFCRELESDFLYVPHLCSCNCRKHLHALHHFVFHVRKLMSCSHLACAWLIAGLMLCFEGRLPPVCICASWPTCTFLHKSTFFAPHFSTWISAFSSQFGAPEEGSWL